MYVSVERHFELLTDAFSADPWLGALIRLLGRSPHLWRTGRSGP
jgi:hypothetical protein